MGQWTPKVSENGTNAESKAESVRHSSDDDGTNGSDKDSVEDGDSVDDVSGADSESDHASGTDEDDDDLPGTLVSLTKGKITLLKNKMFVHAGLLLN